MRILLYQLEIFDRKKKGCTVDGHQYVVPADFWKLTLAFWFTYIGKVSKTVPNMDSSPIALVNHEIGTEFEEIEGLTLTVKSC